MKYKLLITVSILLVVILTGTGLYLTKKEKSNTNKSLVEKQQPNTVSTTSNTPTVTKTKKPEPQTLSQDTKYVLYEVDGRGFNYLDEISEFSHESGAVSQYLDQSKGQLYLADEKKIFTYNLSSNILSDFYTLPNQNNTIAYLTNNRTNNLYITYSPDQTETKGIVEEVDMTSKKSRKIGPEKTVIYGGLHYLFTSTNKNDVIGSFGGDGCGGFGEISLKTPTETKFIVKTGGGCVEDPQYLDGIPAQNKLVLLSFVRNTWDEIDGAEMDSVFTKDVNTGEEKVLLDLKPFSKKLLYDMYDKEQQRLLLFFERELWQVDILTGQIVTKTTLSNNIPLNETYYSHFRDNKLYYLRQDSITNKFNMILKVFDITTGSTVEYNWSHKYPISGGARLLGFWENKPIIGLNIYHYK